METQVLKSDTFGHIQICQQDGRRWIRRDVSSAHPLLRILARGAAAREARVLAALAGVEGVPELLHWDGTVLDRSYIEGEPMQRGQPRDPAYYRDAHRLLKRMRACAVAHNDLAKEPNWLCTPEGNPAVVDFQIAWHRPRRGGLFRLLAREDLRHLLKHKRTYCPAALTPVELRILQRRSWITRAWHATGKRVYKLVARRWFGYWDNEGQGRVRD